MLGTLIPRLLPAPPQAFPLPHHLPLSPYEKVLHAYQQTYPAAAVFTAVARLRGRLDVDVLRRAIEALQRRHPFLRARVVREHGRLSYLVEDNPPIVPMDWIETSDAELWQTEVVSRSLVPFPEGQAPLLRVAVLQSADGTWADLLLTMNHLVADGRSVQAILWDLQSVWPDAKAGAAELPPQAWTLPSPSLPQEPFNLRAKLQLMKQRWKARIPAKRLMNFEKADQKGSSVRRDVLPAAETHRLRRRCREENGTLYGALAAALTQSLAVDLRQDGRNVRIVSPVDFRMLCEPRIGPDQIGCYAWIVKYDIATPEQRTFWELAHECRMKLDSVRAHSAIQKSLHSIKWKLPICYPWLIEARNQWRESGLVSVNDLGAVRNLPHSDELVIEEFGWYTNRDFSVPTIAFNVAMVEGRLNYTLSSPCHPPDRLAELAAEVRRRLESA